MRFEPIPRKRAGCADMFNLRVSINDSVFVGLSNINQVVAKLKRLSKSVFRQTAVIGKFPTIERLVSSTKSLISI